MQTVAKVELIHYKNAIFHGYTLSKRKQGQAIVMYDNRAVLIGKFKNDLLTQKSLILLNPSTYFIGSFTRGLLDGPFVIRSPQHTIYAHTKMNKIQGQILVISKKQKMARIWQIQNGYGTCIREGTYDELFTEQKIIRSIAQYIQAAPFLTQYLSFSLSKDFEVKPIKNKQITQIKLIAKGSRKLTLQLQRQRLICAGVMHEGLVSGLGYIYDKVNELQFQGQIDKNQLHGEGVKKQTSNNRQIYGRFVRGDIRSLDILTEKSELVDESLAKLKKKIHIHSLQYTNDYINERVIYLLRNFIESISQNQSRYSQFKRQKGQKAHKQSNEMTLNRNFSSDELSYNIKELNLINTAIINHKDYL